MSKTRRSGFSLLEATMALTLAALLMAPVVGLLQSSREICELADNDRSRTNALHGTLRHLSRRLRSAQSVLLLESERGKPSRLQIRGTDGQVIQWTHDARSGQVTFRDPSGAGMLADNIKELRFEGFTAAGQTAAAPHEIHTVRCTAVVDLKRKNSAVRTSHCMVWIRPTI